MSIKIAKQEEPAASSGCDALSAGTEAMLRNIVRGLKRRHWMEDDLLQEGRLFLLLREREYPHQTLSWYLQGCRFHLVNAIAQGRSIDSAKRDHFRMAFSNFHEPSEGTDFASFEEQTRSWASALDILELLETRLTAQQYKILRLLYEGYNPTEVGRSLKLSRQAIDKQRRKIAKRATHIGIGL